MRVARVEKSSIAPEAEPIWDSIAGTRGEVRGPYQVLIRVPKLADPVGRLGAYLRYDGTLPGDEREFAVLVVGNRCGAIYEWNMHEPIARKEGTRPEAIAAILSGDDAAFTAREKLIVDVARALIAEHKLDDALYARAIATFGENALVELVTLIGYYTMVASVLGAFDVTAK